MNTLNNGNGKFNPNVSVDCVIFGLEADEICILLIERTVPGKEEGSPDRKDYVLPGNLILENETLDKAAYRVLKELTGLSDIFLEQFHAFGDPDRVKKEKDRSWLTSIRAKPDARVITIAYYSLVKMADYKPQASSFAKRAEWIPLKDVPELGFDHNDILNKGLNALKNKLRTQPVGFELLPDKFTLGQLQHVYEVILGETMDKRNFRRKMQKLGILIPLKEKQKGVPHKPAQYFQFDEEKYKELKDADVSFAFG